MSSAQQRAFLFPINAPLTAVPTQGQGLVVQFFSLATHDWEVSDALPGVIKATPTLPVRRRPIVPVGARFPVSILP
ncbi:hypothetical protein ABIB94_009237 [Bradyrhizobium sp. JR7.2]